MKRSPIISPRAPGGFTLIELLVVVIIIGVLAAIGIPQYTKTIEKARGAEARSGLGHIQEGEKLYYVDKQIYTKKIGDLDINIGKVSKDGSALGKGWKFEIGSADKEEFEATATRLKGKCKGYTIKLKQDGSIEDGWKDCEESEL